MAGVASVLARRALMLAVAVVIIVLLTALILEATGYSMRVLKAIVDSYVKAYRQDISRTIRNETMVNELTEKYRVELEEIYGLNKPWYVRASTFVKNTLLMDFGITDREDIASIVGKAPPLKVSDVIATVIPRTVIMITVAEIICIAIALVAAPRLVYKIGSIADRAVVAYAAFTNALPVWWLAMLFILVFSYQLRVFPTDYRYIIAFIRDLSIDPFTNFIQIVYYAALPIITVVVALLGGWLYGIRAQLIRVIREDFVFVAKAKGLPDPMITKKYIVRVAAPPIMTSIILALASSIGGYIITESVFEWPGMGTLYYLAISGGEASIVMALTYVFTLIYVIARFILEALYIVLDPRIRIT
ncbi:MAG: ABC transporter permease [Desulfurococcaceae archaeon]